MEYTVIGDTVNQAARLEGTAKYYGVQFLVGENTCQLTRSSYRYRELDKVRVVGKQVPVTIYELCGTQDEPESELVRRFNTGLALFRERKWAEAGACFSTIVNELADDRTSRIYMDRCVEFQNNPPPQEWDGVSNRLDK
jgi:adenylate cyclase